ncbi:MAG: sulfatase-like hydrolase/transferase [Acidobacteria bacterium]|nr:sulfatase-like hydrolase/transferase [Acidobacteriota bacterium]
MKLTRRELLAGVAANRVAGAAERRPNIVFILSDDHHYQCFGAAGNPHIRTPNLDRLAARGVHFTNTVVSTTQCAPSRGILLSGLETYQNGLHSNGALQFREGIGPTVIEQLRQAGYDTAVIGKWHIRNQFRECGFARAPLWLPGGSSKYIDPVLRRGAEPPRMEAGHITDLFTDAAIDAVRSAKQPYFLWLAYNAPHTPWHADEKYRRLYADPLPPPRHPRSPRRFDWATYYAVITHLDEAIGRLLDKIDWSNTVVFFLGDNGYLCGTKGLSGKVYPWEESVRVPGAVAGGPVRGGVRIDEPIASIDFPATWLDLAGLKPAQPIAGRSLRRALTSGKGAPEEAFVVWDDGRPEALTVHRAVEPYRQVRTRRHKLIVWESKKQALYDHVEDLGEERNLIDDPKHAMLARDLRARLERRMRATGDGAAAWLR